MSIDQQRVAIVTGVTGGLGPAVAESLAANGFHVVGIHRGKPAAGLDSEQADVTDAGQVNAAVERVMNRLSRVDVLVNVACGFAGGQPLHETDEAIFDQMLNLNLKSAFLWCKAVLPHMLAANYGRIVSVSSRTAVQPAAGLSAYNVAKAGVVTLTHTLAAELRGHNVTANVVLPSVIDTPANRAAMPQADHATWVTPERIAAVIADLASDRWGIVSGALIPVYGDA
jgi:NAD(P)-dependent dehydrogenase (short-subunit alcohol dehydrogenase family)